MHIKKWYVFVNMVVILRVVYTRYSEYYSQRLLVYDTLLWTVY